MTGLVMGLVVLGPALGRGYTWLYDMVIVPEGPLNARALGADGSVPRAVPTDALVALLSQVVPADVLQSLVLLVPFVVVGAGCASWCRTLPGAAAAALLAGWNAYVVERLVVGHWAFLLGYATLPWVALAVRRVAEGRRGAWWSLGGWLALAALAGSTAGLIALLVAVVMILASGPAAARRRVGRAAVVIAAALILNASWLWPALTRPDGVPADTGGVTAFAARPDSPWGVWGSLVTLGGIWHEPSWPSSRSSVVTVGVMLVAVAGVITLVVMWRLWRELRPLAFAGLVGLVLAGAASLPGGVQAMEWLVSTVPGSGLLRDGQKLVAPWAVLLAVALGRVVDTGLERARDDDGRRPRALLLAAAAVLLPVACLPTAPWSAGARMTPVAVPTAFTEAAEVLGAAGPGDVAVLPWSAYRRFPWNDDRVSLDPWNRLLDRRVLVDDDLPLSGTTVEGEDPDAALVDASLARGGGDLVTVLGGAGVRWVVLLTDQDSADAVRMQLQQQGARPTWESGDVALLELPSTAGGDGATRVPWGAVVTAVSTLATVVAWLVVVARRRPGAVAPG